MEYEIKYLLDGLVQKNGHSDRFLLDNCSGLNVEKVKHHQNDTIRDWVHRIVAKLQQ